MICWLPASSASCCRRDRSRPGSFAALAGGLQNLPTYFQQPDAFARLGPIFAVLAVLWIPFVGVLAAIVAAPWASAYLDLKPKDVSATFA